MSITGERDRIRSGVDGRKRELYELQQRIIRSWGQSSPQAGAVEAALEALGKLQDELAEGVA